MRAVDSAASGLAARYDSFARSAERVSRAGAGGEITRDLIATGVDQRGAEANVKVVRAADEMVGTLIDIVA